MAGITNVTDRKPSHSSRLITGKFNREEYKEEWIKSITGQKLLKYDEPQFWEPYIITKKTDWEYQKEWRVVAFCDKGETGLFSDYGFDPRELRSVYLGCNISEEDAKDITSLLKFDLAHIKVFR